MSTVAGAAATGPAHVLLLVTDQFRLDAFTRLYTPNLHSILSETATTFTNAYVSTPTCTPSRSALLTGKSPWNHGMLGYLGTVNCLNYPTTLPSVLVEECGYRTFVAGKNHFGTYPKPNRTFVGHGYQHLKLYEGLPDERDDYDKWFAEVMGDETNPLQTCDMTWNAWRGCPYEFEEHIHPTAWTTRQALSYLEGFNFHGGDGTKGGAGDDVDGGMRGSMEKKKKKRMLLKLSYHRPHSPYDPPKRLFDKQLKRLSSEDPRFINNTSWDAKYLNSTEMGRQAWHGDPGIWEAQKSRAGYLGNVEFVDEQIGQVLSWMKERNLFDHFLIIWTSDHGDMNGDRNLWRKGYPWEQSCHVPLVIKLPYQRESKVSDAIVETRDIAPTLYDYLGVLDEVKSKDPLLNGRSLMGILRNEVTKVRDWLDLEHWIYYDEQLHWNALVGYLEEASNENSKESGIRTRKLWKYIFNAFDASEQLFNLSDDPLETYDLASISEFNGVLKAWRNRMIDQFRREGRGKDWVKGGKLVTRKRGALLGPNYPCLKKDEIAISPRLRMSA